MSSLVYYFFFEDLSLNCLFTIVPGVSFVPGATLSVGVNCSAAWEILYSFFFPEFTGVATSSETFDSTRTPRVPDSSRVDDTDPLVFLTGRDRVTFAARFFLAAGFSFSGSFSRFESSKEARADEVSCSVELLPRMPRVFRRGRFRLALGVWKLI